MLTPRAYATRASDSISVEVGKQTGDCAFLPLIGIVAVFLPDVEARKSRVS